MPAQALIGLGYTMFLFLYAKREASGRLPYYLLNIMDCISMG